MSILAGIWGQIQASLFPHLAESLEDPLTEKLRQVVAVLEIVRIEEHRGGREGKRGGGKARQIAQSRSGGRSIRGVGRRRGGGASGWRPKPACPSRSANLPKRRLPNCRPPATSARSGTRRETLITGLATSFIWTPPTAVFRSRR